MNLKKVEEDNWLLRREGKRNYISIQNHVAKKFARFFQGVTGIYVTEKVVI